MVDTLTKTAMILASVGALNWGLVALNGFNVVEKVAALIPVANVAKIIYILVGLSGAWGLYYALKN
jgi:uncharacterized membrane protein YuzA (DUF378 family)